MSREKPYHEIWGLFMIHLYRQKRHQPSAKRMQEILRVLAAYGLADWIRPLRLRIKLPFITKIPRERTGRTEAPVHRWLHLRQAMEELGPTFVKFGQVLSTRSDILPAELLEELQKLQDSVAPVSWPEIETILHEEYGGGYDSVFSSIVEEPIAAASIAQVHEARLLDGRRAAVKIRRPRIESIIEQDIDILRFIARLAQKHIAEFAVLEPVGIVEEFAKQIRRELDFQIEMQNILRFRQFFRTSENLYIPEVFETVSTPRILVMEYIDGMKLHSVLANGYPARERRRISRIGAEAVLDMVLLFGFFHADPHPGNLFILSNGRLCLLDFGMTGTLNSREQKYMIEILVGILDRDIERVAQGVLHLIPQTTVPVSTHDLERDLEELVNQYVDLPMKYINLGVFIQQMMHVITRHHLNIPSKFLFMGKAISTIEGVGKQLYPEFSLLSLMKPVTRKLAEKQIAPDNLKKKALESGIDYITLVQDMPKLTGEILTLIKAGKLRIRFDIEGIEPLQRTIDTVGTRMIFGLVLAAVMISSSLMVHAGLPPLIFGIPLVGILGFGIAGIMSLGFLVHLITRFLKK